MMRQHGFSLRSGKWNKVKFTEVDADSNVKEVVKENSKDDQTMLYQPNEPLNSKIINYELYVKFW